MPGGTFTHWESTAFPRRTLKMGYGPDDGTLSGPSVLASLVFAPELALPAIRRMLERGSATDGRAARASGFNDSVRGGWVSAGHFGLDQGLIVLMIENFRSGLPWRLLRGSVPIRTGLQRAGFRGGWLAEDEPLIRPGRPPPDGAGWRAA